MDTIRLLRLLESGDITAWPDLARGVERRADAPSAAQALTLLHDQGHVIETAQWLARVTETPELKTLRGEVSACAKGWPVGRLRALAQDLLSGTYRLIQAGSFVMGSPEDEADRWADEPQRLVEITQPFLLKTTPVTQAEWQALMRRNPSRFQGDTRHPVEQVSWEDAVRFGEALSAQTGGAYQLPTEAQWEYACRAGTASARYSDLAAIAWYDDNASRAADRATKPVAQKQPNAWGLSDMLGNVWEWCLDWYSRDPSEPQRDPQGPSSGDFRILRGGAWSDLALFCRAARRYGVTPAKVSDDTGFRLACLLGPRPA